MFQAAIAALTKHGIRKPGEKWKHDFVQAQFAEALVHRRKVFSSRFSDSLITILGRREIADYETTQTSEKTASRTLRLAQNFVEQVKEVLLK
jgi:uncharacterized protein (UPF0332 family)